MTQYVLSPEERAEFDDLMYEAGFDEHGKPLPSGEIQVRVVQALRTAADQAHRSWARYVLDEMTAAGAMARWRAWSKRREVVTVAGESYVTTKAAAMGVRKQSPDGRTYYQMTFWADMTREELRQVIDRSAKEVESERQTIALARRLLALLDRAPEAKTVAEAAEKAGVELEQYLGNAEAA